MDKWDKRFMDLCFKISEWSSCFRHGRNIGAVIVRDKRILTTGYNGAPAGVPSCVERQECLRDNLNIPSGKQAELCYAIHAEQNAIIQAAKFGISVIDATLYCTHQPCAICAKLIVNAGIKRVIYKYPYPDEFACKIFEMSSVVIEQYEDTVTD